MNASFTIELSKRLVISVTKGGAAYQALARKLIFAEPQGYKLGF